MPHYVDIGVVRIQRYLSRTPTLVGRRGASAALDRATTVDKSILGEDARVNSAAGKVDGVLSLVVDAPSIPDGLVPRLLAHMRGELPGAEFQVTWGDGDTYLHAVTRELKPRIARGEALVDLTAGAEFPLAVLCGICRVDPAVGEVNLGAEDGVRNACADCVMRHDPEARKDGRTAERELRGTIGAAESPRGFNELAELAGAGNKEHLATVHADGNAVGQFFDKLAETHDANKAAAVKRLTECTEEALADATCAVRRSDDRALCVVPHVLGGDDVLVSLPADRAWRFTVEFLRDFGQRADRMVRDLNLDKVEPPTMSAGVVFGRRNYPFALTVEHTEHCLRQAKRIGARRAIDAPAARAGVGFADVVTDASGASGRAVRQVPLTALSARQGDLSRLAGLPRSSQVQLAKALDDGGLGKARTQAARLGHTEVIEPFLLGEKNVGSDDDVIELGMALRIARWWRW